MAKALPKLIYDAYGTPYPSAEEITANWKVPFWRVQNLYCIKPRVPGPPLKFQPNEIQRRFIQEMDYRNVILKPRGIGFTTLICCLGLDAAMFSKGFTYTIVGLTEDKTIEIFRDHIKYMYDNFPIPELKAPLMPGTLGGANELRFDNGSIVQVEVRLTSGTYHMVHSTELGPVAAKDPAKAKEFIVGGLPTIRAPECWIFIESTAEGNDGVFFDVCENARKVTEEVKAGTREMDMTDYMFHFFGWWEDETKVRPIAHPITKEQEAYFEKLRVKHGIKLTDQQKWWYCAKRLEQLTDENMRANFPSTQEEPWQVSMEGCIYADEMNKARGDGRIGEFGYNPVVPVDTWWDIGLDTTAIWFTQTVGTWINCIWYFEDDDDDLLYYIDYLRSKVPWKPERYGMHVGPHDVNKRDFATKSSVYQVGISHGVRFKQVERPKVKSDAIMATRMIFPRLRFDSKNCAIGIKRLEAYRKQSNKAGFTDRAVHDLASHGSDALSTLALYHNKLRETASAAQTTNVIQQSGSLI